MTKALLALIIVASSSLAAEPLTDDFTNATLKQRRMERGAWQITDGAARCTQDDATYAKFKNHGPVIWYAIPLKDADIHFSYKLEAGKSFVFTMNNDHTHIFRFVSSGTLTAVHCYPPENDGKNLALEQKGPALKLGEWTDVRVQLHGTQASVSIGKDYAVTVEHPSIARPKNLIGLGFSFGTLSVKSVVIKSLAAP